eukprot:364200-Chlamydomonas_euryale.AAC.9
MHLDAPAVQPLTRPLHAQMVRAFDTRGSRSLNVQEFQKLHEVSTQAPHLLHTPRVSTSPQRKRPHRLTNPAGRAGGGA